MVNDQAGADCDHCSESCYDQLQFVTLPTGLGGYRSDCVGRERLATGGTEAALSYFSAM